MCFVRSRSGFYWYRSGEDFVLIWVLGCFFEGGDGFELNFKRFVGVIK